MEILHCPAFLQAGAVSGAAVQDRAVAAGGQEDNSVISTVSVITDQSVHMYMYCGTDCSQCSDRRDGALDKLRDVAAVE